jgi:glycosyltransferase involved in cell wall biosynthesis
MKILFLQPGYAHYREKLFEILSNRYDIIFLFERSKRTYPGDKRPASYKYYFADQKNKIAAFGIFYHLFKEKPDIVITSVSTSLRTLIAYAYVFLFRKKLILWTIEWKSQTRKKEGKEISKWIMSSISRFFIKESNAIVAGGTATHNYVRPLVKDKDKIFIGIQSTEDLSKRINFRKIDNDKRTFVFLYLSRIIKLKGLDILIKAFSRLNQERDDISLIVAGDGPFKAYCINLCKDLDLSNVIFIGSIDPEYTPEIYVKSDVFILPSRFFNTSYEAWGLVINEAMSLGLPIITTNAVGSSFDLVHDGINGFVIEENSTDALYKAMKKILTRDLEEMSINSRKIFEIKNDYFRMASGFIEAIKYVSNDVDH